MEILDRLAQIRQNQGRMLVELDSLEQEVNAKIRDCDDTACRIRLAEVEAQLARLRPLPSAPPVVRPLPSAPLPPARPLPSAPPAPSALPAPAAALAPLALPSLRVAPPSVLACDQTYRTFSSVREEMYYKLLVRSGCTPRILLPDSLQFANNEAHSLSEFLDTDLTEKTISCLLFQMLWTVLVLQYTWTGVRLGDYLLNVPVHVYRNPRAMVLTVGEKMSFRVDSMVMPVFYNMWYFITCKAEGSAMKQDPRPADDVSDCTLILDEFARHPEPEFDIARKLRKYRSNAYALITSDEFKFLRAPPQSTDTLLQL